jgi:hypothetical protein
MPHIYLIPAPEATQILRLKSLPRYKEAQKARRIWLNLCAFCAFL